MDSYSTLKDFATDRKKYYKKYILEQVTTEDDEPDNKAATIGSLVDCLLLNPTEFDHKFYMSRSTSTPTGLMLQFVEALYKRTRDSVNENGELTREFSSLMQDAYNDVKFDRDGNIIAFKRDDFAKVVEKFTGDVRQYYDEICAVRPNGLIVITPSEIEQAEKVKTELKTNWVTSQIINLVSNNRFEVFEQVALTYVFKGIEFKSLLDKLVIDNEEKTIQPYDLKVTWDSENFYNNYFLYRKTYIQVGLYHIALLTYFVKNQEKYANYKVLPMKFIVIDPNIWASPLIYEVSESKLLDCFKGFTSGYKTYKGIETLITELQWHKENNIWNMSMENYQNKGIIQLNEGIDG